MIHFKPVKRFPHHPCAHQPQRFRWWQPIIVRVVRWDNYAGKPQRLGWNIWVYSRTRTWMGELGFIRKVKQ